MFTTEARVIPEKAASPVSPASVTYMQGINRGSAMAKNIEVAENVLNFIDIASARYGQIEARKFDEIVWDQCTEINSPIEQLFLIALNLVCAENLVCLNFAHEFSPNGDDLIVVPQYKIGTYYIDFVLLRPPVEVVVCVELDGHQFHDRNEKQRRYEKTRDRFLISKGFRVLHFTGAEVVKDPCAVALEAFNLATNLGEVSTHPLGQA